MTNIPLQEFIADNRDTLIERCRVKVRARSSPPPTEVEVNHGVPLFLDQLMDELENGPSHSTEISEGGQQHGRDLRHQGFTVGQVVHDYGDICQSVTDLAVEMASPISTDDFRTLNKCLDNAIAGAVTQYTREGATGCAPDQLQTLLTTAITALDVLQTGAVGISGRTGMLLHRTLMQMRDILDRRVAGAEAVVKA